MCDLTNPRSDRLMEPAEQAQGSSEMYAHVEIRNNTIVALPRSAYQFTPNENGALGERQELRGQGHTAV